MSCIFSFYASISHHDEHVHNKHEDRYDLSLQLFTHAAKCALATRDITSMTVCCGQVEQNATKFEDTLETSYITMSSLTQSMLLQSVDFGTALLLRLGISIPDQLSRDEILAQVDIVRAQLDMIPNEAILNYRTTSDYKSIMTMKFLARLASPVQQVNPKLLPMVAIKMVLHSIEHGIVSYCLVLSFV